MTLSSPSSQRKDFSDPLLPSLETDRKPELPPRNALPAEVRSFLVDLLMTTRDLPEPRTRIIADRWQLGTGDELRTYQTQMFRHLFGIEEGWAVLKEVKLLAQMEWIEEQKANSDDTVLRWLVGIGLLATVSLALVACFADNGAARGISAGFGIGLGIGTMGAGAALIAPVQTLPAKQAVENRLKSDYFKMSVA